MYLPEPETLSRVYGEKAGEAATRFRSLSARFSECFGGASPAGFFSSPGRAEIIGNHVDHNGGQVLAASITLDTICCAAPNNEGRVRIFSEGYHDPIDIRLSSLGDVPRCRGSLSLTAGLIDGLLREGFRCAGFDACVSSNVIPSAGVSSSASYEMLIATVISEFFNDGRLTLSQKAHAGQYAENVWWEKASGLMDQMACAHGGTVLFDFKDEVTAEPVDFTFDDIGCDMILVNSGKGHADLSREYSSVPGEMHYIASLLHKNNLSETTCEDILSLLTKRAQTDDACDRAFLRALHYHAECKRVREAADAIRAGHKEVLLPLITASGNSSWKWLQSCYVPGTASEQPVAVMLALTETFLSAHPGGACRINGGGFGGVAMCVLPKEDTAAYVDFMTPYAGREQIHVMDIRPTGALRLG